MLTRVQFLAMPEKDRLNCTLEGVAYYSAVHTPNMSAVKKFNGRPYFGCDLLLDEANVAKAKSFGLEVKPADDFYKQPYVKIKRKVKEGVEPSKVKPIVVDSDQETIPDTVLIGNGSKVIVKFGIYWAEQARFASTVLFKMCVLNLIPYIRSDKDTALEEELSKHADEGFSISEYLANNSVSDAPASPAATAEDTFEGDPLPWEVDEPEDVKATSVFS